MYLQQHDYVSFLSDYIIDWTLDLPLKPSIIAKLSFNKIKPLILFAFKQLKEFEQDREAIVKGIDSIIMSEGRARLVPGHVLYTKYADRLRVCLPAVDGEANLNILPSGTTIDTMRYDDFVIIEAIITAKNKLYEKKNKEAMRRR